MSESLANAGAGRHKLSGPFRFHPMAPAVVLAIAISLTQFDVTAAAIALPAIRAELGFDIGATAWVMDAYSLAFAGTLFAAGALADRFGRRRALLLGNALFALASLFCGIAWDGPALWAARAVQGMAAALFITGGLAAISLSYPVSDSTARARAFGIIGMVGGAAMALGPALGGLITAHAGWRWVFLVNLPVCAFSDFAVRRVVGESRDAAGRPLDIPGIVLLTLAIALPVQALLQNGDPLERWGVAIAGFALSVAFILQQRGKRTPMIDPALFARRAPLGIIVILGSLSVGYWAILVYLPSYFRSAYDMATEQAGLAMLAATLPMLALPPVGVWLTRRFGWRANFSSGLFLLALGVAGLALAAADHSPLVCVLIAAFLAASGAGISNSQVSGALVALAPPDRAGMASALAVTLRQATFAVGIAVLGATSGAGYAPAFAVAATAAALGSLAAAMLLKRNLE